MSLSEFPHEEPVDEEFTEDEEAEEEDDEEEETEKKTKAGKRKLTAVRKQKTKVKNNAFAIIHIWSNTLFVKNCSSCEHS